MDKIKRFINAYIPITACNFKCSYCYVSHTDNKTNVIPKFKYSAEHIGKALTIKRLGGVCLFNVCGAGETLLPKEVIGIVKAILQEGHYVELVTNGVLTNRIDEILNFDNNLLERLEFKLSFHYLELIRTNTLNEFFDNLRKIRKAGCSFTLELMPHDELIPHIEDIKEICMEEVGALCQLTIGRDEKDNMKILTDLSIDEYKEIWGAFDSPMFDFKMSTFGIKRNEYCYAGDWLLFLNLENGFAKQCYCSRYEQNLFNNISKEIDFIPIGENCTLPHCYNSHALLTMGMIPELDIPIMYSDIRNRISVYDEEWLTPKFKTFIDDKLYFNNEVYNSHQKKKKELKLLTKRPLRSLENKIVLLKNKFKSK